MCGICGLYNFGTGEPAGADLLDRMCHSMRHRGPDDRGVFLQRELALGMRRLSIIDLSGGRQPMHNEDRSLTVVFNGEIYNYRELRETLTARGHTLATDSDTEVIAHLYEEHGTGCLEHLRGMFALALWDDKKQQLFVARDRLGIKPLYYHTDGRRLVFASEIKSLLQDPDVSRDVDAQALDWFLTFRYIPAPRTILSAVSKLPAGHYMTCSVAHGPRIVQYWDMDMTRPGPATERAAVHSLHETISEAVRIRLRADVPLGVFLSGGLDSSAITAMTSDMTPGRVKTFSVGFEGNEFNEFEYSRLVADTLDTEHHELKLEPVDFVEFFPKFVFHQDEPLADPASIPLYFIAKWAREKVTVVLSGEGADEVFGGYPRYASAWRPLAMGALYRDFFSRGMRRRMVEPFLRDALGLGAAAAKLGALADNPSDYFLHFAQVFSAAHKKRLYSADMASEVDAESVASLYRDLYHRRRGADPLQRMLYVDCKTWLPEDLLMKADKMTMATSLELRVPFLDHLVVQEAAAIPSHMKIRDGNPKYILKKVVGRYLPPDIVKRPKVGFPVPIRPWLRSALSGFARDLLCDARAAGRGFFNPDSVRRLLDEHEQSTADHSHKIWNLLCFEQWCRLFIDEQPGGRDFTAPGGV